MNSRNDIQSELEFLNSRLPFDAKMPVFDLPEGYFENFAAHMLAVVKDGDAAEETAALSPLLARLSRQMPFAVPQDYFAAPVAPPVAETLPDWLAAARTNPYIVPQGYFENFAAQVANEVAPKGAKVVQMAPRRWLYYAAAAVVTGIIAVGALRYQNGGVPLSPKTQPEEWVAKKLNDVSNQELEAFILATEVTGTETARQAGGKTEVRKLLTDVPNDELDAFLSSLPAGSEQIN